MTQAQSIIPGLPTLPENSNQPSSDDFDIGGVFRPILLHPEQSLGPDTVEKIERIHTQAATFIRDIKHAIETQPAKTRSHGITLPDDRTEEETEDLEEKIKLIDIDDKQQKKHIELIGHRRNKDSLSHFVAKMEGVGELSIIMDDKDNLHIHIFPKSAETDTPDEQAINVKAVTSHIVKQIKLQHPELARSGIALNHIHYAVTGGNQIQLLEVDIFETRQLEDATSGGPKRLAITDPDSATYTAQLLDIFLKESEKTAKELIEAYKQDPDSVKTNIPLHGENLIRHLLNGRSPEEVIEEQKRSLEGARANRNLARESWESHVVQEKELTATIGSLKGRLKKMEAQRTSLRKEMEKEEGDLQRWAYLEKSERVQLTAIKKVLKKNTTSQKST